MLFSAKDLRALIGNFAKKNKLFLTEAQFQFELAWEIKSKFKNYDVHIEYPSLSKNTNSRRCYYDIVIQDKNEYYVIEVKYKTKEANINYKGVTVDLKNHAAQDLGRFDYLNDISRIENWEKLNLGKKFVGGSAIILTNDSVYWNNDGKGYIYEQFALKDCNTIKCGYKSWIGKVKTTSVGKNRIGGLTLSRTYYIKWENYCNNFKYLLLEIK